MKADERLEQAEKQWLAAARDGILPVLRGALENGVDPNVTGEKERTALHSALADGRMDIVRFLCEEVAGVNMEARDADGNTPLLTAFEYGRPEMAEYLISEHKLKTDVTDQAGNGILRKAAKNRSNVGEALIRLAVDADGALNHVDKRGYTAAHTMVEMHNASGLEYALIAGVDPTQKGELRNYTPLQLAELDDLTEMAALLRPFMKLPGAPENPSSITYAQLTKENEHGLRLLDNPVVWRQMPEIVAGLQERGEKLPGKKELLDGRLETCLLGPNGLKTYAPMSLALYNNGWGCVESMLEANGEKLGPEVFWNKTKEGLSDFGHSAVERGLLTELFQPERWLGEKPNKVAEFYKALPEAAQDAIPNYYRLMQIVKDTYEQRNTEYFR